jgi:hypothetical protein
MPATAAARAIVPSQRAEVPTSLTQPGARAMRCPACDSERVTELTMTLTDGSTVDFLSCHRCEHKRWTQGGRTLELTSDLGKARKER